jgi:hypothetical protein
MATRPAAGVVGFDLVDGLSEAPAPDDWNGKPGSSGLSLYGVSIDEAARVRRRHDIHKDKLLRAGNLVKVAKPGNIVRLVNGYYHLFLAGGTVAVRLQRLQNLRLAHHRIFTTSKASA